MGCTGRETGGLAPLRIVAIHFPATTLCFMSMWPGIPAALAVLCIWAGTALGGSVTIESRTIPRFLDNNNGTDISLYAPIHEYLNLGLTDLGIEGLSIRGSGWGRLGLGSTDGEDRGDAQLSYGYLEWRNRDNKVDVILGRQLLYRGVAAENMDGLLAGFRAPSDTGVEFFVGKPIVSKYGTLEGDWLAGGRVYQRWIWRGEIGVSFLHSEEENRVDRQNVGIDGFIRPLTRWELGGHVFYSAPFESLYEATLLTTLRPLNRLKVSADYNKKNPAVRLGAESIFSVFAGSTQDAGLDVLYGIGPHLSVRADGRSYWYQDEGTGYRYGGDVRAANVLNNTKEEYSLGVHRLKTPDQGYTELRAYALENLVNRLSGALEFIGTFYDDLIHNYARSLDAQGSLIYTMSDTVAVEGTLFFSTNPRFTQEFRGLLKLTYIFRASIGGRKE